VPLGDCRVKKPVPVTSFPSGYLASYVTEVTGCGGPFTPWLVEASPGQTIQLTLYNFSLSASASSSSMQSRVRSASCSAFAIVTEPAVVTRNVTICRGGGDKTGRERLVYSSVTNRLLLGIWLQQQVAEDAPYFMIKYEGRSTWTQFWSLSTVVVSCGYKNCLLVFRMQFSRKLWYRESPSIETCKVNVTLMGQ